MSRATGKLGGYTLNVNTKSTTVLLMVVLSKRSQKTQIWCVRRIAVERDTSSVRKV